jgi:hypothetical protein
MILPALSAGLTSESPAMTLGRPPVSPGVADWNGPAERRDLLGAFVGPRGDSKSRARFLSLIHAQRFLHP